MWPKSIISIRSFKHWYLRNQFNRWLDALIAKNWFKTKWETTCLRSLCMWPMIVYIWSLYSFVVSAVWLCLFGENKDKILNFIGSKLAWNYVRNASSIIYTLSLAMNTHLPVNIIPDMWHVTITCKYHLWHVLPWSQSHPPHHYHLSSLSSTGHWSRTTDIFRCVHTVTLIDIARWITWFGSLEVRWAKAVSKGRPRACLL